MKGLLADYNVRGQADYLLRLMQAEPWIAFWDDLRLVLKHFEDVGLLPTAADVEVWQRCQTEELALLTANRNQIGPDSLEATILQHNQRDSLPVFTIADLNKVNNSRAYADKVVESLGRNRLPARLPSRKKAVRQQVGGGGTTAPFPAQCGIAETLSTGR